MVYFLLKICHPCHCSDCAETAIDVAEVGRDDADIISWGLGLMRPIEQDLRGSLKAWTRLLRCQSKMMSGQIYENISVWFWPSALLSCVDGCWDVFAGTWTNKTQIMLTGTLWYPHCLVINNCFASLHSTWSRTSFVRRSPWVSWRGKNDWVWSKDTAPDRSYPGRGLQQQLPGQGRHPR